ncbi:MAG TPA: (2Fe-2S)-binding protein [Nitriliruptoraceae bacterium]|nr:(2Fe-2S)-binding protein [Nitriliruptoraceae bacterium]
MIVCHCNVVSDRDIHAAIDDGANEPCALASACGVMANCGGCLPTVRRLLTDRGCPPDLSVTVRTVREALGLAPVAAPVLASSASA